MFDLRTNLVTAITAAALSNVDSYHDFKSTEFAVTQVKEGKYPIPNAIIGVGDWRVIERARKFWGTNIVRSEIDIIMFLRNGPSTYEDVYDDRLSYALSKSELSSGDTLICELKKADGMKQIHDNIWQRTWTLEVTALETITS